MTKNRDKLVVKLDLLASDSDRRIQLRKMQGSFNGLPKPLSLAAHALTSQAQFRSPLSKPRVKSAPLCTPTVTSSRLQEPPDSEALTSARRRSPDSLDIAPRIAPSPTLPASIGKMYPSLNVAAAAQKYSECRCQKGLYAAKSTMLAANVDNHLPATNMFSSSAF